MKGAIFDVDGTLLDSMTLWENAGAMYLKSKGIEAEPLLGKILYPMTMTEGALYLKTSYLMEQEVTEIIRGIHDTIRDFYETKVVLKNGVLEFLKQMKQSGISMTIATSSDRAYIEKALKRLQVLDYFSRIFTCTEMEVNKIEPDIFLAAKSYMGTEVSDTWVFEDAIHALQTAKKAGFRIAGIYDASSEERQKEIQKISDIYLEKWDFEEFKKKETCIR